MTTMEDLTKTQIVLLTLLVSFITSIATGIITTSLLAQAPQSVTQTIDRVVERTVERVTPTTTGATVKEVTVVKEGDAIVGAVEQGAKAVVRIKSPAGSDGTQHFYALGIVISKQGLVLTDKRDLVPNGGYTATFSDGSTLPLTFVTTNDANTLALFKLVTDDARLKTLAPITLGTDPKLGQTVIAIEGVQKNVIGVGRVLSLDTTISLTDMAPASETQGGALLNLSGELVGLKTSNADLTLNPGIYTLASLVTRFVTAHE